MNAYNIYGGMQEKRLWLAFILEKRWHRNTYLARNFLWRGSMWSLIPTDSRYAKESQGECIPICDKGKRSIIKPKANSSDKDVFHFGQPERRHCAGSSLMRRTVYYGSQIVYISQLTMEILGNHSPDLTTNDPHQQRRNHWRLNFESQSWKINYDHLAMLLSQNTHPTEVTGRNRWCNGASEQKDEENLANVSSESSKVWPEWIWCHRFSCYLRSKERG